MQRIDTADGLYHTGDPTTGALGTMVTSDVMNALQEEIATFIEACGIALSSVDNTQLGQAIMTLVQTGRAPSLRDRKYGFIVGAGVTAATRLANAVAMNAWYQDVLAFGAGRIPAGHYCVSGPVRWYIDSVATTGVSITGDGVGNTILDIADVAADSALFIGGAQAANMFYSRFKGFNVRTYNAGGYAVQVGRTDLADFSNEFEINISANNGDANAAGATKLVNQYNGDIRVVANCGGVNGQGTSLDMTNCAFNELHGSFGNSALSIGLHGSSYENVFIACDYERTAVGLRVFDAGCTNNLFVGGQFDNTDYNIDCLAGSTECIRPNLTTTATPVLNSVGLRITGRGYGDEKFSVVYSKPATNNDAAFVADAPIGYTSNVQYKANGVLCWKDATIAGASTNSLVRSLYLNGVQQPDPEWIDAAGVRHIRSLVINGSLGFNKAAVGQQTVTGSRSSGAALASLINALSAYGLIIDSTST